MKHRVSIAIKEETFFKVREAIRAGKFKNRSQAFEWAVNEVLKPGKV